MWAAAAMSLSSLSVCLNALRLGRVNIHDASHDKPLRHRVGTKEKSHSVKEGSPGCAIIHVEGMMCENCEAHVKKALETPSLTCLKADAKTGKATISYTLLPQEADLRKVLEATGYTYRSIQFPKEENEMKETVKIRGMMCGHCEKAVKASTGSAERRGKGRRLSREGHGDPDTFQRNPRRRHPESGRR